MAAFKYSITGSVVSGYSVSSLWDNVLQNQGPVFWVAVGVGTCAIFCFFYCVVRSVQAAVVLRKNRNLKIQELNKANRAEEVELALERLKFQAVTDANKTSEAVKQSDG